MSRSTRSSVHLPGNIRDYCVDKETMAPVEEQTTPAGDGVDLQSVMSQLSGDPAKIAELLATMWVNQNKNQNTGVQDITIGWIIVQQRENIHL